MAEGFAEDGVSARDHSARITKKPVTFSAICRASSLFRARPKRRSVRLARADHQLAFSSVADLARDGTVEEAVAQPFDYDSFQMRKRFSDLTTLAA